MNTTRIEVPFTLPEPHFEDEATIATARQVVPIERVRRTTFWRKLRMMLPIFLAATFCGGLGAAAVNYLESRHVAMVAKEPAAVSTEPNVASSPIAVASSAAGISGKAAASLPDTDPGPDSSMASQPTAKSDAAPQSLQKPNSAAENAVPAVAKRTSESEAAKLTRKRRVHPPDDAAPATKRNGAGKIVDVFTGPNP